MINIRTILIKINQNDSSHNIKAEIKDSAKVNDDEKVVGSYIYEQIKELLKNISEKEV